MNINGSVVVGWSGSDVSARALDVAAGFAQRHGVPLRVVLAWDLLDQPGDAWDPHVTQQKMQERLDAAVAPVRERHLGLSVQCEAVLGWPPSIVGDSTDEDGLLVVGRSEKTHGHFGDWSPDALVRRARCPIVWVP